MTTDKEMKELLKKLSATSKVYKNLHLSKLVFLVLYSSPMIPKAVQ